MIMINATITKMASPHPWKNQPKVSGTFLVPPSKGSDTLPPTLTAPMAPQGPDPVWDSLPSADQERINKAIDRGVEYLRSCAQGKQMDGHLNRLGGWALLGCAGAWTLHPSQIAIAKKVFSPDPAEVAFARKILAAMPDGSGAVMIDGKMQDDATWKQARVIVELAKQVAAKDADYAAIYQL